MRKSFKVATVFAGTAAAAAAFAPAAGAATARPAATHYNCTTGSPTNATVLWWPASKHHGPTCVSSSIFQPSSKTNLGNTYYTYFCAGRYSGDILYTNGGHRNYKPGSGIGTIKTEVRSVQITGWSYQLAHYCFP